VSHQVVTLTGQEAAERLIPVLRDYAVKVSALNDRAADIIPGLNVATILYAVALDAARLVCLRDALDKPISAITQQASGLLEHAELESVVWAELKLRLDELEEHLHFSKLMTGYLAALLKNSPQVAAIRKQVEQYRYKAPF